MKRGSQFLWKPFPIARLTAKQSEGSGAWNFASTDRSIRLYPLSYRFQILFSFPKFSRRSGRLWTIQKCAKLLVFRSSRQGSAVKSSSFNHSMGIMANFFSFIFFVLIPLAIGLLGIYLLVDLFEYLKKNHPSSYKQLCYASLFGISADSFFLHLIKPHELIRFLISSDSLQDGSVKIYKKRIRLSLLALLGLFVIYSLWNIIVWSPPAPLTERCLSAFSIPHPLLERL